MIAIPIKEDRKSGDFGEPLDLHNELFVNLIKQNSFQLFL
jgi:hypothetical protein